MRRARSSAATTGRPPRVVRRVRSGLACDAAVVTHGEFARFLAATGHAPPQHYVASPQITGEPIILVSNADAVAYAKWVDGRLPTDAEFSLIAAMPVMRPSIGAVWEWTSTEARTGHVVRGGPWRDLGGPGVPDNRSWEDTPAADVGFRVFYDVDA